MVATHARDVLYKLRARDTLSERLRPLVHTVCIRRSGRSLRKSKVRAFVAASERVNARGCACAQTWLHNAHYLPFYFASRSITSLETAYLPFLSISPGSLVSRSSLTLSELTCFCFGFVHGRMRLNPFTVAKKATGPQFHSLRKIRVFFFFLFFFFFLLLLLLFLSAS